MNAKPYMNKTFLSEMVEYLGDDPRLKFIRVISTPETPDAYQAFSTNNWLSLMKRGYQMLINHSNEAKIDWSLKQTVKIYKGMAIYRGKDVNGAFAVDHLANPLNKLKDKFNDKYEENEINKYERHLTILSNSNFIHYELNKTLIKAKEMYEYNAFIHQYEKYGMDKEDFLDSFAFCQQILYDYDTNIN